MLFRSKAQGVTQEQLQPALELQRQAQWRIDFVAAENSMGFHAPQEAARVLGEAIDYARQGEIAALRLSPEPPVNPSLSATDSDVSEGTAPATAESENK